MAKALEGELIKAPTKAVQSAISRANKEHTMATDSARNVLEAKQAAMTHAIKCGKALLQVKAKVGHGGFMPLFRPPNSQSECSKNWEFDFSISKANMYLKTATYPTLARAALLEDDGDRFNLDRTYAALSGATPDDELAAKAKSKNARERKEAEREKSRMDNEAKVAGAADPETLKGVFSTILIDPPWDWGDEGDVDQMGRARPDYSTMSIDEIAALPVGGLAAEDAHIYLWITNRSLPKGFRLLDAWGFRYITAITWVKPHFGMGNYFRGQTEHLLFGVKGSAPLKRKDAGTVIHAARGPNGHSSKPPAIYDLIESCSHGPYIELFSRSSRGGWSHWGEGA